MTVEIGAESMRNDAVREMFKACDETVGSNLNALLERLAKEGRISPTLPTSDAAKLMQVIGDGLLWRRAIDPDFDSAAMLPSVMTLVALLINPNDTPDAKQAAANRAVTSQ